MLNILYLKYCTIYYALYIGPWASNFFTNTGHNYLHLFIEGHIRKIKQFLLIILLSKNRKLFSEKIVAVIHLLISWYLSNFFKFECKITTTKL